MQRVKRIGLAAGLIATWLGGSLAAHGMAAAATFDIGAGSAPNTLKEFAAQAHVQLLFDYKAVQSLRTPAVKGELDPGEALRLLLRGTGFTFQQVNAHTIAITAPGASSETLKPENRQGVAEAPLLAQTNSVPIARADVSESSVKSSELQEVIVTAQKRTERLQDVPVPLSAISADTLVNNNLLRVEDYYSSLPGLNLTPSTQSATILSIRGITTGGATNPTVGVVVDDVPYGASTGFGGGFVVPDIDPGDLARIELLRGPQGTLYGASSMGGLLKFVTADPSTNEFSGRVQAGASDVYNGAQAGYNVRGSVNVPLTDSVAMRASAFTRIDPGYIDNPVDHVDGVNKADVSGGHLALLWRASDAFSLKLSALYQKATSNGSDDVDVPTAGFPSTENLAGLEQNYLRDIGGYDRTVQAYSATLSTKLGPVDVTSVTGYNISDYTDSLDYSYAYGGVFQTYFGGSGAPIFTQGRDNKFTQEIRLTLPLGPRVDWLVGGFYTHEDSKFQESVYATNPDSGAIVATPLLASVPTVYRESAAFTDLTLHFTDRFDIQLGGRESEISQSFAQVESGPFVPGSPAIVPETDTTASAFTYLFTPRYKISSDLMVYARLASGYRAGGANATVGGGAPPTYSPDKTQDYDLGFKGDFLDHRLALDVSTYYIAWKDIQVQLLNPNPPGQTYTINGSRAKSEGFEFSVNSNPVAGLNLAGWVVFDDAELTEPFPANSSAYGVAGDRLPTGSRFSANASVDETFPLWRSMTGVAGASVSYIGEREGVFGTPAAPERQTYPAYARTDLHAGIKYESWQTNLFVTNLADKRGELTGGIGTFPPFAFTYIQPRTIGLMVQKEF